MKRKLTAAGLVVALAIIAYSNSLNCSFHYDDFHQIVENPLTEKPSSILKAFVDASTGSSRIADFYRPLTFASFAANRIVWGSVQGFHAFNVCLHVLNCLLVFLIVDLVLKRAGKRDSLPAALLCSLLFALHPVQTMAVTYISGRAAMLAAFFCLFSLYSFIRFRESGGPVSYLWGAAAPVLFLAGMFSKEMAVGVFVLAILYDVVFVFNNRAGRAGILWPSIYYLSFIAMLVFYVFLRAKAQGALASGNHPYPVLDYIGAEASVFLLYLRLLLLPFNQNADYFLPLAGKAWLKAAGAIFFVLLCLFFYRQKAKRPDLSFFGLWFMVALLPESTLIPIKDIAVEYRLYLPSVGFIAAGVLIVAPHMKNTAMRKAFPAMLLVLFCLLTLNRNTVWANQKSLWSDVARKSPMNPRAHANLGRALLIEKKYEAAIKELSLSIRLDPKFDQAYNVRENLGNCYYETGRFQEAEREFKEELKLKKDSVRAYDALGEIAFIQGRYADAVSAYKGLLESGGGNPATEYNLGVSYLMLGRFREAEDALLKALPSLDGFDLRYNLAVVCEENREFAQAIENAAAAESLAEDEGQLVEAQALTARLKKYVR